MSKIIKQKKGTSKTDKILSFILSVVVFLIVSPVCIFHGTNSIFLAVCSFVFGITLVSVECKARIVPMLKNT